MSDKKTVFKGNTGLKNRNYIRLLFWALIIFIAVSAAIVAISAYGYLAAQISLQSQISVYMLWIAILLSLLVLMGVIMLFSLNKAVSNPLRLILSRMEAEKIKNRKARLDEFELINRSFSDSGQNIPILQRKLEDSRAILKSGFLKDLLYGNQWTHSGEIAKSLKLQFERKFFQVIVLDLDDLDMFDYNNAGEVTSLLKQEILATTEFYFRKIHPCEVVEPSFGKVAVILNYDSESSGLSDIIRELQDLAKEKLNITVTAAIGSVYENIRNLPVSFREAMQVMEYKYTLGRGRILILSDIEAFSNDTFYYPLEKERYIINAAVKGDFQVAKNALLQVIEDNFENRSLKPDVRYHLLSALAGTVIRILHTINMTPREIFGKDFDIYHEIRDFKELNLFRSKLLDIYRSICGKAMEIQVRTGDRLKQKMLECIENNYSRYDFSLNDMAGQFNLSATYFSDLFKERTGENFIDYLIRFRLAKAKELMSETNFRINEIAGKVGYNNTTSFIRAFKKYEGTSPGKFKEINY